jgi:hypothetical protein
LTFGVAAAVAASSSNSDNITPGVLGFLVFVGIAVALVFLLRSMNKQFRKITPDPRSAQEPQEPQPPGDGQDAKAPAQTPNLDRRRRVAAPAAPGRC